MTTSYSKYINSSTWQDIRKKYLEKHLYDETILYKGKKVKATDVHHLSYQNLGKETSIDLMAVCDDTHNILHTYYGPQYVMGDEHLTLINGAGQRMTQFYFLQRQYEQENNIEYNSRLTVKFLNYISNTLFDDMHLKNLIKNENPDSNKFIQTILNDVIKFKCRDGYEPFVDVYQYYVEQIKPDFMQTMNKMTSHNTIDDGKTKILNSFSLDEIQDALKLYILIRGIKTNSIKKPKTQKVEVEKVEKSDNVDNVTLLPDGKYNRYSQNQLKTFLGRDAHRKILGAAKSYMGQYYQEQTNEYPYFNKCAPTADKFVDYIKNHGDNGMIVLKNYLSKNY